MLYLGHYHGGTHEKVYEMADEMASNLCSIRLGDEEGLRYTCRDWRHKSESPKLKDLIFLN